MLYPSYSLYITFAHFLLRLYRCLLKIEVIQPGLFLHDKCEYSRFGKLPQPSAGIPLHKWAAAATMPGLRHNISQVAMPPIDKPVMYTRLESMMEVLSSNQLKAITAFNAAVGGLLLKTNLRSPSALVLRSTLDQ